MAFLDKAGLQTLTNKLVQGDAIKVASSRGYTVKNVIDNITRECSDVESPQTMTLEDKTGHFIVGKGKDIDVSGDVEAGKMSFGFKGRTLQSFISQYEYLNNENRIVTYPTSDEVTVTNKGEETPHSHRIQQTKLDYPLNRDSVYTAIYDLKDLVGVDGISSYLRGDTGKLYYHPFTARNIRAGSRVKITFRTPLEEDITHVALYVDASPELRRGTFSNFMILAGDLTNEEIVEYTTGIKSSFETEEERKIIHTGKNLIDEKNPFDNECYYFYNTGKRSYNSSYRAYKTKVRAGIDYILQGKQNVPDPYQNTHIVYYTSNGDFIKGELFNVGAGETLKKITPPKNSDYLIISNGLKTTDFQMEEGRDATEYTPYIKEEKIIELDEPLRGLPNGVCDEITEDGRLIRRVGKIILTHETNWVPHSRTYENNIRFNAMQLPIAAKYGNGLLCDRLPYFAIHSFPDGPQRDIESITVHSTTPSELDVTLLKNRISPQNKEGFLKWVKANPITVYYERVEPEITNISDIKFDVSQHNRIDIMSVIVPATAYKTPLNRAAQIDNSIKTIQELKQRIELLEQAYDNHFLESQYKLSLLKLEHQIESEEN